MINLNHVIGSNGNNVNAAPYAFCSPVFFDLYKTGSTDFCSVAIRHEAKSNTTVFVYKTYKMDLSQFGAVFALWNDSLPYYLGYKLFVQRE